MGDGELSVLGQILFTVKKTKKHLIFEKIGPTSVDESQADFLSTFTEQAKNEILSICTQAVSERNNAECFHTNLYGRPYNITLITQFEHAFVFLAAEDPNGKADCAPENSAFYKLCSVTQSGVFFWRVKNNEFYLSYANASYFLQTGLPDRAIRKKPDDIYSPKKASLIRSHLENCVQLMSSVSFHNKLNKKTFAVTFYPEIKDGLVVRVMGVSTDITEQAGKIDQLEQSKMQAYQYETMLQEHIRFEEVLSRSAREFLDSGLSGFNDCLQRMVLSLGPLFEADWAFACKSNTALCGVSSQWLARAESGCERLRGIAEGTGFCAWASQLRAGRILVVNDIHKELPSLYTALKNAGSPEVCSFIAVPVLRSDEFWGVLCVASFYQKRIWTTREISGLKTAADIVMSAYLRTKTEKQLSESNRVLVEYDECLQDMLSVQESLSTVTRQFLSADPQSFGHCVSDMLMTLSDLADIDQACITILNEASPKCYSWHKKGLCFQAYDHEKVNLIFSGWNGFLNNSEYVAIEDISQEINTLPTSMQDYIMNTGLKSLLIIPIRIGDSLTAVMFLVKVLGSCHWENPIIHTAKQFAELFQDAYSRMCKQRRLLLEIKSDSDTARETLAQAEIIKRVAECAQQLIDATAENLSSIYCAVCRAIAEHLPVDSINLTQYSQDYTKTFIVFNWRASGALSKSANSRHTGHDSVVLSIPVFYRDIVWGCLLVNLICQSPADGFMKALEMVAECFVRAYMRIHPDKNDFLESPKHIAVSLSPRPFAI